MTKYLDQNGLSYFWSKIVDRLNQKANIVHTLLGQNNIPDPNNDYLLMIGNGADELNQNTVFSVNTAGNVDIEGDLNTIGDANFNDHIYFRDSIIDRDGNLPQSVQIGKDYVFLDKDGEKIGAFGIQRDTNGKISLVLYSTNETSDGTQHDSYISLQSDQAEDGAGNIIKTNKPLLVDGRGESWDSTNTPGIKVINPEHNVFVETYRSDIPFSISMGINSLASQGGIWCHTIQRWLAVYERSTGKFFYNGTRFVDAYDATLQLNSANASGGSILLRVRGNIAYVHMAAVNIKSISGRSTIATIPAGYRPAHQQYGLPSSLSNNGANSYFIFDTDGSIKVEAGLSNKTGLYATCVYRLD